MSRTEHVNSRRGALALLLVVGVVLSGLLLVGCTGGASSSGGDDQKAMLETIGKFYQAQGALDLDGMKASLYDPQNISGIATATIPPDAQKAEVAWKAVGETVVITVPSQELTLTVSVAKSPANAVTMTGPDGQTDTLIMKKDGGVWKIDVAETQKANAAAVPPAGSGAP